MMWKRGKEIIGRERVRKKNFREGETEKIRKNVRKREKRERGKNGKDRGSGRIRERKRKYGRENQSYGEK